MLKITDKLKAVGRDMRRRAEARYKKACNDGDVAARKALSELRVLEIACDFMESQPSWRGDAQEDE